MEYTILRYITISMAAIGIWLWAVYYIKYREPVFIAPITWLINCIAFSVFKLIVGSNLDYYLSVSIWSNVLQIHAIVLLITAVLIFREVKMWKLTSSQ